MEIRNSTGDSGLAPGLDVRGTGGYVVAPSSMHVSGQAYEWSIDHHPDEVPLESMPEWLVARLVQPTRKPAQPPGVWQHILREGVTAGGRNQTIARLTGYLLYRNIKAGEAHELMQAWNEARCDPPLEPEEVTKAVASIARAELKKRKARDDQRR